MFRILTAITVAALTASIALPATAQDTSTRKVVRKVEAIPLWVKSEKLRIRDNPYAGTTIGIMDRGTPIKAYGNQEHWVRISPAGQPQQWVNAKFLSGEPVNWASFKPVGRRDALRAPISALADDMSAPLIPVTGRTDKIYAAIVREAMDGNRIIVTKSGKAKSVWFEKRFVSCSETGPASEQVISGGESYMAMEKGAGAKARIIDKASRDAIATFACSSRQF